MLFQDELTAMTDQLDLEVTLALEQPPEDFEGHIGFIDRGLLSGLASQPDSNNRDYYVCGPPVMIKAVEKSLKSLSIPRDRILYEQLGF